MAVHTSLVNDLQVCRKALLYIQLLGLMGVGTTPCLPPRFHLE